MSSRSRDRICEYAIAEISSRVGSRGRVVNKRMSSSRSPRCEYFESRERDEFEIAQVRVLESDVGRRASRIGD